jgi:hypothetical protein
LVEAAVMRESVRTVGWTALLVLGVGLAVMQLDHDRGQHQAHAAQDGHDHGEQHRPQRLFSWEPEEAHVLVLRGRDGPERRFVRGEHGWRAEGSGPPAVTAPGGGAFDPGQYVALLSQARKDREFAAAKDALESFDLAPAIFRVRVKDGAGAVLADVAVGARTPDGFGRYVQPEGEANVLIVPNYQFEVAMKAVGLGR